MLYLWSCNQSVACKCRNWNKVRPNILDNESMEPCKIPEFWELQICIDVTVLLHSIWELLSNTLFAFTFDYMHFFQFLPLSSSFFHFLPEETGRNTFFPVSSILLGRNLLLLLFNLSLLRVNQLQCQALLSKQALYLQNYI